MGLLYGKSVRISSTYTNTVLGILRHGRICVNLPQYPGRQTRPEPRASTKVVGQACLDKFEK
jgi:hypothetical protein